jgi:hypothetical protein
MYIFIYIIEIGGRMERKVKVTFTLHISDSGDGNYDIDIPPQPIDGVYFQM